MTTETELHHLRRAVAVSVAAREHGNHPFGAVLVDPSGAVVLEAENTVNTSHDVTHHAELNLVRLACASIPYAELPRHTLYTSCEPCAMCAGAIYWAGIGRVVYALSEEGLLGLAGNHPDNPTLMHPCRKVFAAGSRVTDVSGPLIEDEAAVAHRGFWV